MNMSSCSSSRIGKNYQIKTGKANPKTKIAPVIPPPSYDFEHWRGNKKYLLPSIINSQRLEHIEGNDEYIYQTAPPFPSYNVQQEFIKLQNELINEKHKNASIKTSDDYDRYLFTSNIQPNISTRHEVMDPINANLGISYTPQFDPRGVETNDNGITYVRYDDNSYPNFATSAEVQNIQRQNAHVKRNAVAMQQERYVGKSAQNEIYKRNEYLTPYKMKTIENNLQLVEPFSIPREDLKDEDLIQNVPARAPCTKNQDTDYWIYDRNVQPYPYHNPQMKQNENKEIIEPLNNSVGVNYDSNFEPVNIEVGPTGDDEVTVARWDPQLVRDNEHPNRIMENPKRDRWSAKMSPFEAASMTANIDEIYDPRWTGYGDETRSYYFPELGQVRYYYSDVDAYRLPNYVIRSNVDHMLFQDPMGAVKPVYYRNSLQENVRDLTNQKYMQDTLNFREDLTERMTRKMNERSWQYRFAPLNRNAKQTK